MATKDANTRQTAGPAGRRWTLSEMGAAIGLTITASLILIMAGTFGIIEGIVGLVNTRRNRTPTTQRETIDPPIPSTGPARRRTPDGDLFHEPEAHPKTAATGIPPSITVRGHRPAPGRPQVIQAA